MKYRQISFEIFDTKQEAQQFCDRMNEDKARRKYYKAHYTHWCNMSGTECGFVAWYAV